MPAVFPGACHCCSVHSVPWHWCTWVSSPWWSLRDLPSCLEKKVHIFHLSGKLSQLLLLFLFNNPVNKCLLEAASWHLGHQGWLGAQHGPVAWSLLPLEGWRSAIPSYGSINTALLSVSTEIAVIETKMRQMASLSSCQRDFLMLFALYCQPEAFAIVKACHRFSGSVFLPY